MVTQVVTIGCAYHRRSGLHRAPATWRPEWWCCGCNPAPGRRRGRGPAGPAGAVRRSAGQDGDAEIPGQLGEGVDMQRLADSTAGEQPGEHLVFWSQQRQPGAMCSPAMPGAVVCSCTEPDSHRRHIGCGTLASDASGSNSQLNHGSHGRRPRSRGLRHVAASAPPKRQEHQVAGRNRDDPRCAHAGRRVFASNEIRGALLIRQESSGTGHPTTTRPA